MDSTKLSEVKLTDSQVGDDCVKHVLHVAATDGNTVTLTLDENPPVLFNTEALVSAQDLYEVFHFITGAKYELTGLDANGQMDKSVYRDFFALIQEIVIGLNGLNPGPIDQATESEEDMDSN